MSILYEEEARAAALTDTVKEILSLSRTELCLHMRFLDVALSSLTFAPDHKICLAGTDGTLFYFHPEQLAALYRTGLEKVNRLYLHSILHCVFAHPWLRREEEERLWNLSCDIAIEHIIDTLTIRAVHQSVPAIKRELYGRLAEDNTPMSAQRIFRNLTERNLDESRLCALCAAFAVDDHSRWGKERSSPSALPEQKRWEDIRDRMQTEMEVFGKDASDEVKSLEEQVCAANQKHCDYREFLRKFSVMKEEMQVDPDSFDYIYYHYGMELYGNLPLIEPLETREVQKIEDFVIVLDTSQSCEGDLLLHFLEETYGILSESESFFRKFHIHILQCDDRVQEDVLITSQDEMKQYLEHFTVRGGGGTDFRPAFLRVQELLQRNCFRKLRGLLYLTDG